MTRDAWRKGRHLPTLASRPDLFYAREEVDVANTAFWEGKEFRISYEFSVDDGAPITFRFDCPVDFILQLQSISVDQSGIRYRAFRSSQGVESGTFDEPIPIFRQNFTAEAKDLDPLTTILIGGTFTPNVGEIGTETIRLRTAGATAQKSTISASVGDERGVGTDIYYLILERLPEAAGTDPALGVFDLKWEEIRPDD